MSSKVMEKIWAMDGGPEGMDRLVLLCLADFANDEGVCSPGFDRIISRCNIGVSTLLESLSDLIDEGHLAIGGDSEGGPTQFTILDRDAPRIISGT